MLLNSVLGAAEAEECGVLQVISRVQASGWLQAFSMIVGHVGAVQCLSRAQLYHAIPYLSLPEKAEILSRKTGFFCFYFS